MDPGGGQTECQRIEVNSKVSRLSHREGWAAGDGSFTEMQQTWRETGLEGKIERSGKKPAERPEERSGWLLNLKSWVFQAVGLSELTWAVGVIREEYRAQNPQVQREREDLKTRLRRMAREAGADERKECVCK